MRVAGYKRYLLYISLITWHDYKLETGSVDIRSNSSSRERMRDRKYRKLRKALCVGYASQLADRMTLHNGYHPLGFTSLLVQVVLSCFKRMPN